MKCSEKGKSIDTEGRLVVSRGLGREERGTNGNRVSFGESVTVFLLYNFVMAIECGEYIKNH